MAQTANPSGSPVDPTRAAWALRRVIDLHNGLQCYGVWQRLRTLPTQSPGRLARRSTHPLADGPPRKDVNAKSKPLLLKANLRHSAAETTCRLEFWPRSAHDSFLGPEKEPVQPRT